MNNNLVVEIAEFKLADGTDEGAFLVAADAMMPDLKKQSGFVARELLKGEDNQWMDIIHWKSLPDAEQAAQNVIGISSCLKFFEMIDQTSVRHFGQIKRYQ